MASKYLLGIRLLAIKFVSYLIRLEPVMVTVGRLKFWLDPKTGRLIPVQIGGEETAEEKAAREKKEAEEAAAAEEEEEEEEADPAKNEPDWKNQARKHERRAKAEKKAREAAEAKLKEQDEADKTEQQKAIDAAKEEGRTAALTEAEKERRGDRLEVAVTRLASKGVKVGDDENVKFADTEDALLHLEKAIKRGDVDEDDIFDSEGKVQTAALTEALVELLENKKHLRADGAGSGAGAGSADAGRGGGGGKEKEEMSVDDHLKSIRKHKDK